MRERSKRWLAGLLCLCMAAGFCGCSGVDEAPAALPISQTLPPAPGEQTSVTFEAELYFMTADGRKLSAEERVITMAPGASRLSAVIDALIQGPRSQTLQPVIQPGLSLVSAEWSVDTCNVYLRGEIELDTQTWLIARAAIAETLYAAEAIPSVNLFYNGAAPGYYGRPLGAQTPITTALDVYLRSMEQEYLLSAEGQHTEAGSYESRIATLFFADETDVLLLARNAELNYDRQATLPEIVALLVSKLSQGDAGERALEPVMPADLSLVGDPVLREVDMPAPAGTAGIQAASGQADMDTARSYIAEIAFTQPHHEYDADLMCGALTLTLTGYLPQLRGVRVALQTENGQFQALNDEDGYFTREMFASRIGAYVPLIYPDAEGASFYRISRAVAAADAYDPAIRLAALLDGPADPGVPYEIITAEDMESIYIVGDTAVMNWKTGFSQKLADFAAAEESALPRDRRVWLLVYGMINTITEIPGIQRVWMLEAGKKLGEISGVYLSNALLRNPGIITGK